MDMYAQTKATYVYHPLGHVEPRRRMSIQPLAMLRQSVACARCPDYAVLLALTFRWQMPHKTVPRLNMAKGCVDTRR